MNRKYRVWTRGTRTISTQKYGSKRLTGRGVQLVSSRKGFQVLQTRNYAERQKHKEKLELIKETLLGSKRSSPNKLFAAGRLQVKSPENRSSKSALEHRLSTGNKKATDARQLLLARKKLQQAKDILSGNKQVLQREKRQAVFQANRGLATSIRSKSSTISSPLHVQMAGGQIVRGLHSDRLLLERKNKTLRTTQVLASRNRENVRQKQLEDSRDRKPMLYQRAAIRGTNNITAVSSETGLTIRILNKEAHPVKTHTYSQRKIPQIIHPENFDDDFSSDTHSLANYQFTVQNEEALKAVRQRRLPNIRRKIYEPEEYIVSSDSDEPVDEGYAEPATSRGTSQREEKRLQQARTSHPDAVLKVQDVPQVVQKHVQTLNSRIQKEIAQLQGKDELPVAGPGPGVKGLSLLPSTTQCTLNQRFVKDRP